MSKTTGGLNRNGTHRRLVCAEDINFISGNINTADKSTEPIPVAERSTARVRSRSLAGFAGSNPARGMDVCFEYCVVEVEVEVSSTG